MLKVSKSFPQNVLPFLIAVLCGASFLSGQRISVHYLQIDTNLRDFPQLSGWGIAAYNTLVDPLRVRFQYFNSAGSGIYQGSVKRGWLFPEDPGSEPYTSDAHISVFDFGILRRIHAGEAWEYWGGAVAGKLTVSEKRLGLSSGTSFTSMRTKLSAGVAFLAQRDNFIKPDWLLYGEYALRATSRETFALDADNTLSGRIWSQTIQIGISAPFELPGFRL